jgi:hypothetical protein
VWCWTANDSPVCSMTVYLASPNTQQQAEHVCDMPVLVSYAVWSPWMERYQPTFDRVLVDSGVFSELSGGAKVEIEQYREWSEPWLKHADAIAGIDDIRGDWHRSLKNYEAIPWSFPTFHDSDPIELLPELIAMARERSKWIGIGLVPPREGKERFLREVLSRIPDDLHIHGWALRLYTHLRRLNSVDSTNWWRDAMALRKNLPWLTYGECLAIIVKRYIRWNRVFESEAASAQSNLWQESA